MRVPLHSGSRLPLVTLPDDAVLLGAPPPLDPLADVRAAVTEAFRYPLAGPPLGSLAPRGGRATVVVQPPAVPLPTAQDGCTAGRPRRGARRAPRAAVAHESGPSSWPVGSATARIAVRWRRSLRPDQAREFRGTIVVHDCEADDLRPIVAGEHPTRVHPAARSTPTSW